MTTDAIRRPKPAEAFRRENLSRILRLVHSGRSVPRSTLTRGIGVDRSTVARLVAQLVELGLVRDAEPAVTGPARLGRPSRNVAVTERVAALVVHPETDAVTIGTVALGGTVIDRVCYPTIGVPTPSEVVNIAVAVVAGMRSRLERDHRILGAAVAVPGTVDSERGMVLSAPNLGWSDVPLGPMLEHGLQLDVTLGNDATAGALAECTFGVGRSVADFVYLYGGENGVGGAIVLAGKLLRGSTGQAGEFGHTLVRTGGATCRCGRTGCLETEVSRRALLRAAGLTPDRAADLAPALAQLGRSGITSELREATRGQLEHLLIGADNIIRALDPGSIVLGGFLGPLLGTVESTTGAVELHPGAGAIAAARCVPAQVLDHVELIGAAELVFARILDDPFYRTRWESGHPARITKTG